VGQIQNYMGYVKTELAEKDQKVRGIIIALEDDIRLQRALSVASNIDFIPTKSALSWKRNNLMSNKNTNMNTNKEQERAELHRAIWQIANNLRGSVDGWDFKQYVLGMLFYRFISENLTNYINADERRTGKKDFDYSTLADKEAEFGRADTVKEKGFYILPSELFVNVVKKARNDANLNETLSAVFRNIENSAKGTESEDDLRGLFDDLDVNSNKLGATVEKRNSQLTKLFRSYWWSSSWQLFRQHY